MLNVIIETLVDGVKLLPFLFMAFLFIELLEHKFSKQTKKIIRDSGKFGPLLGALLGLVPQCGFSVVATNLYVTKIISLGTLISIYLSTSDEMIPILLSKGANFSIIVKVLLVKFLIGILCGFVIDFIFKGVNSKSNYEICKEEKCHCGESQIIKSSLIHTINIFIFILVISFILNLLFEYGLEEMLKGVFNKNVFVAPLITSLIGFIPNCGSSVIITELYLNNVISFASAMSGLLTGSGVALLVLFRSNKDLKENVRILSILYLIGVVSGIFLELIGL